MPEAALLRRRLLGWYRRRRRDLPWRATADPYRIWVSEITLQQTQVATAIPFYQTFLERFPDVETLAHAPVDDVLAAWAGLGYYRRARHLHAAAGIVVREHGGRVPRDPEAFARLPGIGRYSMGAVLSIGFDLPLPVLDGNVARVLSRIFMLDGAIRDPVGAKHLWMLAERLVPQRGAGDWNQALMELGATHCAPRAPDCAPCPIRALCGAHREGAVDRFPPVPPRRRPRRVALAAAWIEREGRVLMVRREGRLLEGMWEPPSAELRAREAARPALDRLMASLGIEVRFEARPRAMRHRLTHRDFDARIWRGAARGRTPRRAGVRWIDPGRPAVPLTGFARRLAAWPGRARAPKLALGPLRQPVVSKQRV
jgi:A/G-specific adenine glycosylase